MATSWTTKDEIHFLENLKKKDLRAFSHYVETVRVRKNWGAIDKNLVIQHLRKEGVLKK